MFQLNYRHYNPELVEIYQKTINYCRRARFPRKPAVKLNFNDPEFDDDQFNFMPINTKPAMVLVENIDTFDMALKMSHSLNSHEKILVLNLASDYRAGGGVAKGSKAQEEDLYRRSNYFQANNPRFYPLASSEAVYSPLVYVVKNK